MKNSKTTPRPWLVELNAPCAVIPGHLIKSADEVRSPIALLWEGGGTHGKPRQKANAEFIVKAVNEYDALSAVAEAARALAAVEIERCYKCDGRGIQPHTKNDACHRCGGVGDIAHEPLPQDIIALRDAQNTLAALRNQE